MPEDDPYDLERYWARLRGPRPPRPKEPDPPPPPAPSKGEQGFVWVGLIGTPEGQPRVFVGPRLRTKAEFSGVVAIHCEFPTAMETLTYYGAAVWQTGEAPEPLYVGYFPNASTVLPGDHIQLNLNITFT